MPLIDDIGTLGIFADELLGELFIVELDGGTPQAPVVDGLSLGLKDENGDPITVGESFVSYQVEANTSNDGYTVVIESIVEDEYLTWDVASDGTVLTTDFVPNIPLLETEWGQDINGDGITGLSNVPVESDGVVDVVTFDGAYLLVLADTTEIAVTDLNGDPVTTSYLGDWRIVQVEADLDASGNYKVLWQNGELEDYVTWTLDGLGQQQQTANSQGWDPVANVVELEPQFQADFDGDMDFLGVNPVVVENVPVESDGVVDVVTFDGAYLLVLADTTEIAVTDLNGDPVTTSYLGDWRIVQVEADLDASGNYKVLWQNGELEDYVTWTLDGLGQQQQTANSQGWDPVANVVELEPQFQADFDGDMDFLGVNPVVVENVPVESDGVVDVVTFDGAYLLVLADTTEIAVTDLNGDPVTTSYLGDWRIVQVEADLDASGNYKVLWQNGELEDYVTWTLDGLGQQQQTANTLGWDPVANVVELEPQFQADFDGDMDFLGVNPVVVENVPVESDGVVDVVTFDGAYLLVLADTTEIAVTDLNGDPVTTSYLGDWRIVQVEADLDASGNYKVLWQNGELEDYVTWTLDGLGQQQQTANTLGWDPVANVVELEPQFQADFDGDMDFLGVNPVVVENVPVESDGVVDVVTFDGAYLLVLADTTEIAVTDLNGDPVTTSYLGDWRIVQVEADLDASGNYKVLWQNGELEDYVTWTLDALGQQQQTANSQGWDPVANVVELEPQFQADFDGDMDFLGVNPVVVENVPVESDGVVDVVTFDGAYLLVLADTTEIAVTDLNGDPVTTSYLGDWRIVQVEADLDASGNYKVLWQNGELEDYVTWTLDGLGQQQQTANSQGWDPVANVVELEPLFDADLNGDTFQFVEGNGGTVLQTSTSLDSFGEYSVVNAEDVTIGITINNVPVTDTAATIVQAEQTAVDEIVLLLDDGTEFGAVWALDGSGDKISEFAVTSAADLANLEQLFQFDLNGNGDIDVIA